MIIKRSIEMLGVGYFLARCGRNIAGKPASPPVRLATDNWNRAYTVFFAALASGRTLGSFCNSLKNTRDMFDSHLSTSGRVGWREVGAEREPAALTDEAERVFTNWQIRTDDELWTYVSRYADIEASGIADEVLRDSLAELGPNESVQARTEGGKKVVISTRTERNPRLRADAIRLHGTSCSACGFNFAEVYGEIGVGFIEVHHLVALGGSEAELSSRITDPATDLTVLCANCHRVVHRRRGIVLTLDELRKRIDGEKLQRWAVEIFSRTKN